MKSNEEYDQYLYGNYPFLHKYQKEFEELIKKQEIEKEKKEKALRMGKGRHSDAKVFDNKSNPKLRKRGPIGSNLEEESSQ